MPASHPLGSPPPVEVTDLTRDFGTIRAVDHLSFRVEAGEIVGLLGPNGAGKTTTLRMLTGSLIPTEGQIRLAGFDVLTEGSRAKAQLGYIPEEMPLYGEMSVREYLSFVASIKGIGRASLTEALASVRARLDLGTVWDRPARTISRGYRQRVGLSQALLGDPRLLVLDEPTAGLDPNQIREFRSLLRSLGRERAILLSTHILPEALEVCDRVMIMNKGRLAAMDRPDHLARGGEGGGHVVARLRCTLRPDPGDARAQVSGTSEPDIWRIEAPWDEGEAGRALARFLQAGAVILEWRTGAAGLEEIFRRLTLGGEES